MTVVKKNAIPMDPAASHTLQAQVTMFQELLYFADAKCYLLFPRKFILNKTCHSAASYPRTVISRTVGYVPFHSICYNLAPLTAFFTRG